MNMLSNEKINFKSLEEKTFKEMMKLGRKTTKKKMTKFDLAAKAMNEAGYKIGESQSSLFDSKSHKPAHLRKQIGRLSYKHQH